MTAPTREDIKFFLTKNSKDIPFDFFPNESFRLLMGEKVLKNNSLTKRITGLEKGEMRTIDSFFLIDYLEEKIYKNIYSNYKLAPIDKDFETLLKEALLLGRTYFPKEMEDLALSSFCLFKNNELISSTTPRFPFQVFFSDKAKNYIAPYNTPLKKDSRYFLLDNIISASYSHKFNFLCLKEDIWNNDQNWEQRPSLKVKWKGQSVSFEIERVLATTFVLSHLEKIRTKALKESFLNREEESLVNSELSELQNFIKKSVHWLKNEKHWQKNRSWS